MLRKLIVFILSVLLLFSCKKQTTTIPMEDNRDLLQKLQDIPGISVTEIAPQNGYPRQFEIFVSQPLDHENPGSERFDQLLYLSHRDEKAPMVFMPSGYGSSPATASEMAALLNANQIYATHRFMRGARPDNMEWEYLTMGQAAQDHHRIVELFKNIYQEKWASYGASKNGITALVHRRFYPNDVLATLSKVAPFSFDTADVRYDQFLESVGDEATRAKLKQFQRKVLMKQDTLLPLIREYIDQPPYNLHYTHSSAEFILVYEVCEYPFAFWQTTPGEISSIPDTTSTALEYFNHLLSGGSFPFYSDEYRDYYEPCFYQFYTEQGYYRLVNDHLTDLLLTCPNPSYSNFLPENVTLDYSPAVMEEVVQWLQTEGDNIIYIYGEQDPWTAGQVNLTGQTNAVKVIQPGANHYINISSLDEKEAVYSALEAWLEVDINEANGAYIREEKFREPFIPR